MHQYVPLRRGCGAVKARTRDGMSYFGLRFSGKASSGGSGGTATTVDAGPSASLAMEKRHTGCAQNFSADSIPSACERLAPRALSRAPYAGPQMGCAIERLGLLRRRP
jgi:hypothetical protein